jgi:hypothetical protein
MRSSIIRPQAKEKKQLSPIWWVVGFLLIVVVFGATFLGSYFVLRMMIDQHVDLTVPVAGRPIGLSYAMVAQAEAALKGYLAPIPFGRRLAPFVMPVFPALVITMITYGILAFAWSFFSTPGVEEHDVRTSEPRKKPKRQIRKCR